MRMCSYLRIDEPVLLVHSAVRPRAAHTSEEDDPQHVMLPKTEEDTDDISQGRSPAEARALMPMFCSLVEMCSFV
ncbi:MFS transporter [Anopheles sinensis]|uniref:MFS transporter n=1 Tax=Anopheles sinensis TaxID=74873 RepID=A0A084VPA6_ANOSI|nr:MFS transporter [Anopheles sinensis]